MKSSSSNRFDGKLSYCISLYELQPLHAQVIRAERVKFTRMADMARCQNISLETHLGAEIRPFDLSKRWDARCIYIYIYILTVYTSIYTYNTQMTDKPFWMCELLWTNRQDDFKMMGNPVSGKGEKSKRDCDLGIHWLVCHPFAGSRRLSWKHRSGCSVRSRDSDCYALQSNKIWINSGRSGKKLMWGTWYLVNMPRARAQGYAGGYGWISGFDYD